MHTEHIIYGGNEEAAGSALILLHGRGSTAEDILSLATHLPVQDFLLAAPQATNHTWYPHSFLAPPAQNEPWLSSALDILLRLVHSIEDRGIPAGRIYFAGFSQGACLTLEFAARNARRYGGIAAFTGGLIGDAVRPETYTGNFDGTPVFIGSSDPDMHVPVNRVAETETILKGMGADVRVKIYPGMGHTIVQDEIAEANRFVFR